MVPSQPRTLEGKVAIVTGASRGIGYAIAYDLAARGAKVTITYSSSSKSKEGADELISRITSECNSSAIQVQCNLSETSAAQQIIDATTQAFGDQIDILVNNAAIVSDKRIPEITLEHFDQVFHLNTRAPLLMLQAVLPHLRAPGRIINISSVGARAGYPATGVYSASKAALEAFTRNWAAELGTDGTTVNAVSPGPIQTRLVEQADEARVRPLKEATFVEKRVGLPEEVAEIVGFLAEGRSSWVSGQCISASGGYKTY